jgi:hypothetical protein
MNSLRRYDEDCFIDSKLDPMSDVKVFIEYLTSKDYLVDLMRKRHGLSKSEAARRATEIIPHVKTALDYIHLSQVGSPEVAFLPAYYAVLNFLKVYILLGPHHADLPRNRHHGARYPGYKKTSQSLLTEEIVLLKGGVLPLFYKTLTGVPVAKERKIRMDEVYPFVADVGAEFHLATGQQSRLGLLRLDRGNEKGEVVPIAVLVHPQPPSSQWVCKEELKVLLTFRSRQGARNQFIGKPLKASPGWAADEPNRCSELKAQLRSCLIYYPINPDYFCTPICSKHLLLPEEFPIALLFFHMSCVVRYKPDFLARVRDSKCWPILAAAQRHSLFKMMLLFWSYVHKQNLVIEHGRRLGPD